MSTSAEPPDLVAIRHEGDLYMRVTDFRSYLEYLIGGYPEHAETLELLDDAIVSATIHRQEDS